MKDMEIQLETFKKKIENANNLVSELELIRHDTSNYENLMKSFEQHMIQYKQSSDEVTRSLDSLKENRVKSDETVTLIASNISSLMNQSKEYVNQLEKNIHSNKAKIEDLYLKTTLIVNELHKSSENQKKFNYAITILLLFTLIMLSILLYWTMVL